MSDEVWLPVKDFPCYHISNLGNVKRVGRARGASLGLRKLRTNKDGYLCVTLQHQNVVKGFLVSRLVCEAFQGPCPFPGWHAAHWNGVKNDNRSANLRWASKIENEADKERHGTRLRGESHPLSKITESDVRAIRLATGVQAEIARRFNVSQPLVSMIKSGAVWAHLDRAS